MLTSNFFEECNKSKAIFKANGSFGELCCDIDMIADARALEDFADGGFAAGINIGGVVIIHARIVCRQDLGFRFCEVDLAAFARKAHTAEAEDGNIVAVFVFAILHKNLRRIISER